MTPDTQLQKLQQLQKLRRLKYAVTVAFLGNKAVLQPVFHEAYECNGDERLGQFVTAGLLLGVNGPGMTEARFKNIAARVSKAIQMVSILQKACVFELSESTVASVWKAHLERIVQESATILQIEWIAATSDPARAVCCKRLRREFEELGDEI